MAFALPPTTLGVTLPQRTSPRSCGTLSSSFLRLSPTSRLKTSLPALHGLAAPWPCCAVALTRTTSASLGGGGPTKCTATCMSRHSPSCWESPPSCFAAATTAFFPHPLSPLLVTTHPFQHSWPTWPHGKCKSRRNALPRLSEAAATLVEATPFANPPPYFHLHLLTSVSAESKSEVLAEAGISRSFWSNAVLEYICTFATGTCIVQVYCI